VSDERGVSGTVLDQAVAAVPGIASLVITFRLPEDLRPLAETSLVVVIIGTLSWLFVQRDAIRKRRSRAIQRTLIRATILAIVCYLGYGLAYGANVSSYSFGDGTGRVFAPSTLRGGSFEHPFIDCSLTIDRLCDKDKGTLRYLPTADAVASFITVNGPGSVAIPRTTSWYLWLIALVVLDALAASSLVALFGIVRIRGLRPLDLLREGSAPDQSAGSGVV
jgi:hypothetical protein